MVKLNIVKYIISIRTNMVETKVSLKLLAVKSVIENLDLEDLFEFNEYLGDYNMIVTKIMNITNIKNIKYYKNIYHDDWVFYHDKNESKFHPTHF